MLPYTLNVLYLEVLGPGGLLHGVGMWLQQLCSNYASTHQMIAMEKYEVR